MDQKTYAALMAEGASGTPLAEEVFEDLVAFARAKRLRRPAVKWRLLDEKTSTITTNSCEVSDCDADAKSKGMCTMHYTRERRRDPSVRAKANDASRRSAAKRSTAKKEATG